MEKLVHVPLGAYSKIIQARKSSRIGTVGRFADSGCDCKLSTDTFAGQPWCVMAGFVLVLIPTAAVFLLFQKVILRGIVLPSMK